MVVFDEELLFYATSSERATANNPFGTVEDANEYRGEAPSLVEARIVANKKTTAASDALIGNMPGTAASRQGYAQRTKSICLRQVLHRMWPALEACSLAGFSSWLNSNLAAI
ncbi:hypothetical protein E5Q_05736 [Mixia osmundae IAM 14324]|uniref:Uncharacterized protein n=1 Tax=Mixia osmundae (strain CBS 9802 / IAM 14324 / JCM 22182 / KY 12970) TaxID=764103 RepID=G7E887_MIXOS|nr:hypothetical protein E5Q_05736 [Mixia osmundae IAM 14324]